MNVALTIDVKFELERKLEKIESNTESQRVLGHIIDKRRMSNVGKSDNDNFTNGKCLKKLTPFCE